MRRTLAPYERTLWHCRHPDTASSGFDSVQSGSAQSLRQLCPYVLVSTRARVVCCVYECVRACVRVCVCVCMCVCVFVCVCACYNSLVLEFLSAVVDCFLFPCEKMKKSIVSTKQFLETCLKSSKNWNGNQTGGIFIYRPCVNVLFNLVLFSSIYIVYINTQTLKEKEKSP